MDYQRIRTESKFGAFWIVPTSATHIHCDAGSNLNVAEEGPAGNLRHGPLTVNGVAYAVSLHLHRHSDGTWQPHEETAGGINGYHPPDIYMSRVGSFDHNSWTQSARTKAIAELLSVVSAWTATKDGAKALAKAEREHRAAEIEKRNEEVAKLRGQVATLEAEIKTIMEQ